MDFHCPRIASGPTTGWLVEAVKMPGRRAPRFPVLQAAEPRAKAATTALVKMKRSGRWVMRPTLLRAARRGKPKKLRNRRSVPIA